MKKNRRIRRKTLRITKSQRLRDTKAKGSELKAWDQKLRTRIKGRGTPERDYLPLEMSGNHRESEVQTPRKKCLR